MKKSFKIRTFNVIEHKLVGLGTEYWKVFRLLSNRRQHFCFYKGIEDDSYSQKR
jgi:hypothetical protein